MRKLLWVSLALLSLVAPAARAAEHPYILWTRDEAAVIRRRIETEPWARAEYERLRGIRGYGEVFSRLFRYSVMGDEEAGAKERKYLLSFIGAKVGESRRHTEELSALRYDVLYHSLTPEQRSKIEATFRKHIQHELDHPYRNTRVSWLPNMQWPRLGGCHLMALATGDEKLMRAIWTGASGMKWYFDEYLADGGLYFEEFGKIRSLVGTMLLWCRGCDRLGLEAMGYGYRGTGGATMRSYVESLVWIGYPRITFPRGLPHYGRVTMGDAKGSHCEDAPRFLLQHALVPGTVAGDDPGWEKEFPAANMNGRDHKGAKVEKLGERHWFEVLAAKYPEGPFRYFLAQMRRRGDPAYRPTLFWGFEPIAPDAVGPPPAPSRVFPERGFAMLRADESPAYWEGPGPAVSLQFATLYVHYLADCFSLLGYYAYNRPIYFNRTISAGYNGGPYDFHVRGHCGVVVDGLQAQPIGPVPERHDFSSLAKFVAVRTESPETTYTGREVRSSDQPKKPATQVYPGVDLERALVLTEAYLFDVYRVESDRPRAYHWLVHALGEPHPDDPKAWRASDELAKTLFAIPEVKISGERRLDAGKDAWNVSTLQTCALEDVKESKLGPAWHDRKVGVRVSMLGEPGTAVFTYDSPTVYTPGSPRTPKPEDRAAYEKVSEVGGVSVAVARTCPSTTFVALHEPFEGGRHRIERFDRIARADDAVAVRIGGESGLDDRILVALGPKANEVRTLSGGRERFTFAGYAFVRVGPERVEVAGELRAMTIEIEGRPNLVVNGEAVSARVADGLLTFGP